MSKKDITLDDFVYLAKQLELLERKLVRATEINSLQLQKALLNLQSIIVAILSVAFVYFSWNEWGGWCLLLAVPYWVFAAYGHSKQEEKLEERIWSRESFLQGGLDEKDITK